MINTVRLDNTSLTSHNYHFVGVSCFFSVLLNPEHSAACACFVFNDLDSSRAGYLGSLIGVRLGCSVARRTGCRALLGAGGTLCASPRWCCSV